MMANVRINILFESKTVNISYPPGLTFGLVAQNDILIPIPSQPKFDN